MKRPQTISSDADYDNHMQRWRALPLWKKAWYAILTMAAPFQILIDSIISADEVET